MHTIKDTKEKTYKFEQTKFNVLSEEIDALNKDIASVSNEELLADEELFWDWSIKVEQLKILIKELESCKASNGKTLLELSGRAKSPIA